MLFLNERWAQSKGIWLVDILQLPDFNQPGSWMEEGELGQKDLAS